MTDLREDLARSIVGAPVLRLVKTDRALVFVLAELALAQCKLDRLRETVSGRTPTREEDALWTEYEDTIWLRKDEARSIIERQTGVAWSSISGADL